MIKNFRKSLIALGLIAVGVVYTLYYQNIGLFEHDDHSSGHKHAFSSDTAKKLKEPGQGAFAAMTEITKTMRDNPDTDWGKANLQALRDHLVDMDLLMTGSKVSQNIIPSGLRIVIDLTLSENNAASRMVPAHAPVLSAETGWKSAIQQNGKRLFWTVSSKEDFAQIQALGFFGLMAVGDHHREHHWGMANGAMVH